MYLGDTLLACPSCGCHARSSAVECPFCGARLRNDDGSRTRTAGAVLLGLVLAASPAVGCGGNVSSGGSGGGGGMSTTGGMGGMGGHAQTDYGVPPTTSNVTSTTTSGGVGGAMTDYGVPPTTTSGSGGAGGH